MTTAIISILLYLFSLGYNANDIHFYTKDCTVWGCDIPNDEVVLEYEWLDCDDNVQIDLYDFTGIDDWEVGDKCYATFCDMGTPYDRLDDVIVATIFHN